MSTRPAIVSDNQENGNGSHSIHSEDAHNVRGNETDRLMVIALDNTRLTRREALEELALRHSRRSLLCFTRATFKTFEESGYHRTICNALDAVNRGEIKRLILTLPPRHSKTELAVRRFIPFYFGAHPDHEIIMTSYGFELVKSHSKDIRRLMANETYLDLFPESALDLTGGEIGHWRLINRGSLLSQGIGGAITGHGANLFVIDDPLKNRDEAESRVANEKVYNFYTSTAYTRLAPDGAIVIIQTRWVPNDLVGRIKASTDAPNWTIIELPARDDNDRPLFPERFSSKRLKEIENAIGPYDWRSLYMARPSVRSGNQMREDWFKFIDEKEVPEKLRWIRPVDLATTTKKTSDFSASLKMAKDPDGNLYIRDGWCEKLTWAKTKAKIVATSRVEGSEVKLFVEAQGGFLIAAEELRERLSGKMNERTKVADPIAYVEPVYVHNDKMIRALGFITLVEEGKVFVVGDKTRRWVRELMYQAESFPTPSVHDDLIDCCSLGFKQLYDVGGIVLI